MAKKRQLENKIENQTIQNPQLNKTYFILIGILLVIGLLFVFKGLFIAALVNGQPILRGSVIKELEKQGGKQTLDSVIVKTLILQEAQKKKINISQKEIDNQLKTIEKNIATQGLTLDQALKQEGLSKNDLIDQIKVQLSLQKLVGDNIAVTDKEINDYIAANKEQLPESTSEAVLKQQISEQLTRQKEQQKIQDFLTQLKNKAKITYFVQY